ncbi:MAG TPA: HAMP domain-containing sensor histidine kinase [Alphaproteobacteria bacterium]
MTDGDTIGWHRLPSGLYGLSARLLVLTMAFVMLAEFLIYSPSIARFRLDWLEGRIASAHLAALSLEATPDHMVSEQLKTQLLAHAGAHAIIIAKPGDVRRVLAGDMPPVADATVDLREGGILSPIAQAYLTLFGNGSKTLRVFGPSPYEAGDLVEVLVDERPLRSGMLAYSWRILGLSIVISLITAALVFLSLQWLIVRPLRRLTTNMVAFRNAPDNPGNVIEVTPRGDEIGLAQRGLAEMEQALRSLLRQQARLAALGTAVTKISHDLRGILSTAQLLSDRLADSSDPNVQRLAPTLIGSVDRAVALCSQTLDYARDDLPPPRRSRFILTGLVDEVGGVVGLLTGNRTRWEKAVPSDIDAMADRDQMFRVLVNLGRNSAEAGARSVRVSAKAGSGGTLRIEVADDGPGLPPKAREKLFTPFTGSARAGGTGLGLVIARDLVRGHGGDITVAGSSATGTIFAIELPGAAIPHGQAAE